MAMYHVIKDYDGGNLESLYTQHGETAYDIYAERWPEAGELGQYHVHYIHCHTTLEEAEYFQDDFGGEILEISTEDLEVKIDDLEYAHPMVEGKISSMYIRRLK